MASTSARSEPLLRSPALKFHTLVQRPWPPRTQTTYMKAVLHKILALDTSLRWHFVNMKAQQPRYNQYPTTAVTSARTFPWSLSRKPEVSPMKKKLYPQASSEVLLGRLHGCVSGSPSLGRRLLLSIQHMYFPQNFKQIYIPKSGMEGKQGFQGTGAAFLGYLADDGIRCRTRGKSCFRRLLEIPCNDLIHNIRNTIRE